MSHEVLYLLFGLSISLDQSACKQNNFFFKPPPFYQPLPHIILTLEVPKLHDPPYPNYLDFLNLLGEPPRANLMQYQTELTPREPPDHSNVEILETIGYALPSEITFNHPVTYAKEYLLDTASSDSSASHPGDLLTGEQRENEEILAEVETKSEEKHTNRYYFSSTSNATSPKNIYEVISPEDEENVADGGNVTDEEDSTEKELENDAGLEVLGLENRSDRLVLLLPSKSASAAPSRTKRNTNDSFNVNISAGYGVGIDQDSSTRLPHSTTQINSTNPLKSLLRGEHVVIGKYPKQQEFPAENPVLMGMNDIQQILRNVDNSGYSKIVQVVKVPAVYEIHLEKHQTNQKHQKPSKPIVENNVVYGTNKYQRPAPRKVQRRKKNTPYPMNHQNYYKPEYVPYYPPVQQHPVYTTLTSRVPFIDKRTFSYDTREKTINPDDISITIQPGTTMVTLPKAKAPQERNFLEQKPCDKGRNRQVSPPELRKSSSNIDNVYFTTLKPLEKEKYYKAERRSGTKPIKYLLYINKITTDTW
ncbi:unnamed protein product [Phyllotreta striolata]|uniref:Uncharacterized protein n=1 Tax=Phyllotreta striolata TaxID=444603 RepID=A0A9N9TI11_PHYSR|nr:unnamed protein product [Phyllotreta striolata]